MNDQDYIYEIENVKRHEKGYRIQLLEWVKVDDFYDFDVIHVEVNDDFSSLFDDEEMESELFFHILNERVRIVSGFYG